MEHEEIQSVNGDTPRVTIQEGDSKHKLILCDAHRDQLVNGSGIDLDVIRERGYRSVTKKAELISLGFKDYQCRCSPESPGLLMPVFSVLGEVVTYMVRFDNPRIVNGKPLKYEFPSGSTMVLDVHPRIRPNFKDINTPLFITEGQKKVDALISHGQCTIGVLGVWNWRGKNKEGGKAILDDFDEIALNNREVYIVYDSDVMTKKEVHEALRRLSQALKRRAAHIRYIYLPHNEDSTKVGVDDYLVQGHTIDELLALAQEKLEDFPDAEKKEKSRIIAKFNAIHAEGMLSGKCIVIHEKKDPITGYTKVEYAKPYELARHYEEESQIDDNNAFTWWMASPKRRKYEDIVFDPSGKISKKYYNLYRGFAVQPKQGDCDLYLNHIHNVIASGNPAISKYIEYWMADIIQRPANKPGVSLVLRGGQGTGKGIFCSQFGTLFGPHFKHVTNPRHLLGNFNMHLADALVVFADEAFWAGSHEAEGVLKALITEDYILIEPKGINVFPVKNHIHLLVASNKDWVVPAGFDERRFCVLDVSDARKQDKSYFKAIVDQMNHGGREALLAYLQTIDLTDVNLNDFPKTAALAEQKIANMEPIVRFWLDVLSIGGYSYYDNQGTLRTTELHVDESQTIPCTELLNAHLITTGNQKRKSTETEFGIDFKKLIPTKGFTRRKVTFVGLGRPWCYCIPSLTDCRRYFETLYGNDMPWQTDEDMNSEK